MAKRYKIVYRGTSRRVIRTGNYRKKKDAEKRVKENNRNNNVKWSVRRIKV